MATQVSLNDGAVASAGALAIQTNGTTQAVSISTGQVATLAQNPILTSGTANGVAYLNGSKVLTTGSALTFDGSALGVGNINSTGSIDLNKSAASAAIGFRRSAAYEAYITGVSGGGLELQVGAGLLYKVNIDATGNLGIGTTTPIDRIHAAAAVAAGLSLQATGTGGSTWRILSTDNAASIGGGNLAFNNGSYRMTLDASGNLGIANTSMGQKLAVNGGIQTNGTATLGVGFGGGAVLSYESPVTRMYFGDGTGYSFAFSKRTSSTTTDLMTLTDSGNLLIGATSSVAGGALGVQWSKDSNGGYGYIRSNLTTTYGHLTFYNPNGQVGQISTNGSATTYATSSDYRLKENIAPMTGALDKVAALKPVTYKWKADGSDGEGFIAHELQAICPDAVTGQKDAVDAEGKPVYQGIDTSFLVATLTAAIKEQQALITTLTARITALEGA
jgi:hypothetical protein